MLLGVSAYIIKQVKHLVFFILVIVGVAPEFALDLELLAKESGILSIREWHEVKELLRISLAKFLVGSN